MILDDARVASLSWVRAALGEETGNDLPERAEALVEIALAYEVTIEELVAWIHYPAPGKHWSTLEFKRWARKLAETRRELEVRRERDAREQCKVCERCWANLARRVGPRWICSSCGEVE